MKFKLTNSFIVLNKRILKVIMRTFLFLFCTAVFSFSPNNGFSQNAKINIDTDKSISVEEVFNLIKNQTDYKFVYRYDLIKDAKPVFIKKGIIKAGDLLSKGLEPLGLDYEFTNNTVIVKKKMHPTLNVPIQETFKIKGSIKDKNGNALPGISVYVSSTEPVIGERNKKDFILRGTSSGIDGDFTIEATLNYYIAFSGLGYQFHYEKITNKNRPSYDIILKESLSQLDEVVVVGYGRTVKKDLTGSVGSIKAKEIVQVKTQTIDQALVGKIPGVFVSGNGGAPGSGAVVNIRGLSALRGDNQPLYVIDGVPIVINPNFSGVGFGPESPRSNPLLSVNPNDVERIDVLKDASAAGIYGSRAANGVILITTKRSKKNQKAKFNFSLSSTIQNPTKKLNFLNASQYKDYTTPLAQATLDNFGGPSFLLPIFFPNEFAIVNNPDSYFGTADTDWQDEITNKNALWNQYNFSVNGGSSHSSYYFSARYEDQEGTLVGSRLKRYGINANVDSKVSDKFQTGFNFSYNYTDNRQSGITGLGQGDFRPDLPVYNTDNTYSSTLGLFGIETPNPLGDTAKIRNKTIAQNFLGSLYGEYEIVKNLKFKSQLSVGLNNDKITRFVPSFTFDALDFADFNGTVPVATLTSQKNNSYSTSFENTLSYNNTFNNIHKLNAVVGLSYNKNKLELEQQVYSGFPDNNYLTNPGSANSVISFDSNGTQGVLNSVFGRVNYSYKNKYLATFTARSDGSTKFAPGNQYGFFPSGALAWNLHNESFLENNKTISQLKLRASLGRTGSDNSGDFSFLPRFGALANGDSKYNNINGITITGLPNNQIKWSETDQFDLGLEFGLFNNRLNAEVVYFDKKTSDIILFIPVPSETGFLNFDANTANVSNNGWEFNIGGDIIRNENFRWNSSFNVSFVKNNVDRLNGGVANSGFGNLGIMEGKPIGTHLVFDVVKIAETQGEIDALNAGASDGVYDRSLQQPGDYIFRDVDGDGEITRANDRVAKGDINPDYFGGWNNTITYKNFDLSFNFQFVQGVERSLQRIDRLGVTSLFENKTDLIFETWTPNNTSAAYARLGSGTHFGSSKSIVDASYIRLRSTSLGFNVPNSWLKSSGISTARFSLSANNLFTITNYPGIDPESVGPQRAGSTVLLATDSDNLSYPQTRSFTVGVNVSF